MKNSPITNTLGIIFLIFGFGLYVLPIFFEVKKDYTDDAWYVPLIMIAVGVCFILIPDYVIKGLIKLVERKSNDI